MQNRPKLSAAFHKIVDNVYYDPPESIEMEYPAIKYNLVNIKTDNANNSPYITTPGYSVTLMDWNPDSEYVAKILALPYCSFDRHYTANDLHHWTFTIYN